MRKFLGWSGVLLIVGYLVTTCLVQVNENELVLITQFGSPVRVVDEAGLVSKLPDPIQTAVRLDRRLQAIDSDLGEYLTRDKKNLVISAFIMWRIDAPLKFLQSVKDNTGAEQRLMDLAGSELGVAIGNHALSSFLTTTQDESGIPQIVNSVTDNCREQAREAFGIHIIDIRLRRLGFPKQNLLAVHKRMRAERERMAKKYRAEGEEAAAKIRSQTDKEVRELLATAYREAQIKRGQGEAESIRIYAEAFQKDPEFYKLTRTLESYGKFLDDKTTLILSAQSPLFKYLETPPDE